MLPTITVDVGTTSVKLSLLDAAGVRLTGDSVPTPTTTDDDGEVYDTTALLAVIGDFVRGLDSGARAGVRRIAVTGVGEAGGLVGPDLRLVSPMIAWHDQRGAGLLDALDDDARRTLERITGLPVNPNYALSKVAWAMARAEPDDRVDVRWLNVVEYVAASLTGHRYAEYSLASRTLALDVTTRMWSPDACAVLEVPVEVFPPLRAAGDGIVIRADIARRLDLDADVRVHIAGHDHMVGAVAADLRRGELLNSTGTTEGLLQLVASPHLDARTRASRLANGVSPDAIDGTLFASIPTGGAAFATLLRLTGLDAVELGSVVERLHHAYVHGRLDLDAAPTVVPYFRGSPPPVKRAADRGGIAGIGTRTTREDIVLGCFLGLAVQFAQVLALFPPVTGTTKVIGPASANALWLQVKADLLDVTLSVGAEPQVVSRGAQALASGIRPEWSAMTPSVIVPDPGRHRLLRAWVDRRRPVWDRLAGAQL